MTAPATRAPLDSVFAALADPTRRELLRSLIGGGPLTTTELSAGRDMSRQAVAKHLAVLTDAGLLRATRQGRDTRYEATKRGLAPAARWLRDADAAWERRLDRLRRQVDARRA